LQENFTELLERAMHANFHCAHFAPEQAGDFVVPEFLKAAQNQEFPFVFRQLHEGARERGGLLLLLSRIGT
jgi:hypothetical protein